MYFLIQGVLKSAVRDNDVKVIKSDIGQEFIDKIKPANSRKVARSKKRLHPTFGDEE